jgi:hypothetical protein
MAKLYRLRLDDLDDGGDVVAAHRELELAIGAILGIEDGQNIGNTLFGTVAADGSFTAIRFTENGQQAAASAAGFIFSDGTTVKKLGFVSGKIEIWERTSINPEVWTLIYDYETVDEPNFYELTDVEVGAGYSSGYGFKVNTGESGLIQGDVNAQDEGYTQILEMDDIDDKFDAGSSPWGSVISGYDTQYFGYAFGVNALGTLLEPVDLSGSSSYGAYFRAGNTVLPAAGMSGGGSMVTPAWSVGTGSSTSSLTSLNGVGNAGIRLDPGVYQAQFNFHHVSGVDTGFILWRPTGTLGSSGYWHHPYPYPRYFVADMPSRFLYTQDRYLYHTGVNSTSGTYPKWDGGNVFLVADNPFTFGIEVAANQTGHTIKPKLTIERIQ